MSTITVTLDRKTIDAWRNSVHVGNYMMKTLQARGAPVNLGVFPTEVRSGRIVIEEDDFGDLVVRWEP